MTVPPSFQVFDLPVAIPGKDAERLSPYLSGWPQLNEFFLRGVNEIDLKRLVILEMLGSRREQIVDRLLMRLGKVQRKKICDRIKEAIHLVRPVPFSEREKERVRSAKRRKK